MMTKTKIVAAAILMAAVTSPALASDPTFEQFYANSGQPFTYLGKAPSAIGKGPLDAFAQATGQFGVNAIRGREPVTLQMQRWYDRQSDYY
jgi:hypothetical protein